MSDVDPQHIASVRRLSRAYVRRLGLAGQGLSRGTVGRTEYHVLGEIADRGTVTNARLLREISIEPGFLSRTLSALEAKGLVTRTPAAGKGRATDLALTEVGRQVFEEMDETVRQQVAALLGDLAPGEPARLVQALQTVDRIIVSGRLNPVTFRDLGSGDLGWIVHRQGLIYAQEYGFDETFEATVAEIGAAFVKSHDPAREKAWVAERDGQVLGCVFLVRRSDEEAQLRLLYVEPHSRGLGIARRLIEECIRFARAAGYRTLRLWTNSVLTAAGRLYDRAGFRMVSQERHSSFGHDLVGQVYELKL